MSGSKGRTSVVLVLGAWLMALKLERHYWAIAVRGAEFPRGQNRADALVR
jgi:hypothetical protein